MIALMLLDHDALPFFPILIYKTKLACWEEHVRLPTYVVLLRNNPILKGVFANILVACPFDLKCLWAIPFFLLCPLSLPQCIKYDSPVLKMFELWRLWPFLCYISLASLRMQAFETMACFCCTWNIIIFEAWSHTISFFCSIMFWDMTSILSWDHW